VIDELLMNTIISR